MVEESLRRSRNERRDDLHGVECDVEEHLVLMLTRKAHGFYIQNKFGTRASMRTQNRGWVFSIGFCRYFDGFGVAQGPPERVPGRPPRDRIWRGIALGIGFYTGFEQFQRSIQLLNACADPHPKPRLGVFHWLLQAF